jgi:hypothetical protein
MVSSIPIRTSVRPSRWARAMQANAAMMMPTVSGSSPSAAPPALACSACCMNSDMV